MWGSERPLLTLIWDLIGVLSDPGWSFLTLYSNTPGCGRGCHLWVSASEVWGRQVLLCPPMAAPHVLLGPRFPLQGYRLRNDRVQTQWHVLCVCCCPFNRWLGLGVECMPGALSIPCPHRIPVLTKEETEAQRGHVAHLRVTCEFKERKAALLVGYPQLLWPQAAQGRRVSLGYGPLLQCYSVCEER